MSIVCIVYVVLYLSLRQFAAVGGIAGERPTHESVTKQLSRNVLAQLRSIARHLVRHCCETLLRNIAETGHVLKCSKHCIKKRKMLLSDTVV
jgi:hypothetical protein